MKRIFFIFTALFFIMVGVFIDRYLINATPVHADENLLILAQAQTTKKESAWVARIDSTIISMNEFKREFDVHVYSLPLDEKQKKQYEADINNKKKFLTNLINEYLIYQKALAEGYDKRQFVQDVVKAVTRRAIIQVYLNEKIEPKLKDIPEEQIEAIYNQNKKLFAGVDLEVAEQQIKMQLLQRQYNEYLNELIDELKGEAKVVKNDNIEF